MTCTYYSSDTFTVPAGVPLVNVDARGAQGGGGTTLDKAAAGRGGCVQGTLSGLTADEVLRLTIGGAGGYPSAGSNGGGPGASLPSPGWGGGGATDVRSASGALLLLAGGGGGAGGFGSNYGGDGGLGGGGAGSPGLAGGSAHGGGGGGGATTTNGGFGGYGGFGGLSPGFVGSSGTSVSGGEGGFGGSNIALSAGSSPIYGGSGGGGGGGYFGGGGGGGGAWSGSSSGGGGGAGGGGSNYLGAASYLIVTNGCESGNGKVILWYGVPPAQLGRQTPAGLCQVTRDYVKKTSGRYQKLPRSRRRALSHVLTRGCKQLAMITAKLTVHQRARLIAAYKHIVAILQARRLLTSAQARKLAHLAEHLPLHHHVRHR